MKTACFVSCLLSSMSSSLSSLFSSSSSSSSSSSLSLSLSFSPINDSVGHLLLFRSPQKEAKEVQKRHNTSSQNRKWTPTSDRSWSVAEAAIKVTFAFNERCFEDESLVATLHKIKASSTSADHSSFTFTTINKSSKHLTLLWSDDRHCWVAIGWLMVRIPVVGQGCFLMKPCVADPTIWVFVWITLMNVTLSSFCLKKPKYQEHLARLELLFLISD